VSPLDVRILIADDEPNILSLLARVLGEEGYTVFTATGGKEACETAEKEQVHLALVDLTMQDASGLEVLKFATDRVPSARVIIMTAFATAETAVEAMKQGALDYLIKPFSLDELKIQIRRAAVEVAMAQENRTLRRIIERRGEEETIIGESPAIGRAVELAGKVASSQATVLITGETGTGKELAARLIHRLGQRKDGPFLAVNCGALTETLLEREMFGNEKGAFTGADAARPGLLEAASEGTLFLDEISEMTQPLQVKLLRVIEGHAFLRVGGTREIRSRTRFLGATNKDLNAAVATGGFRQDLFFRLNVLQINLPPLRERGNDVLLLAEHFMKKFRRELNQPPLALPPETNQALLAHSWPGNVRELRNAIERAAILSQGDEIQPTDLGLEPHAQAHGDILAGCMNLPHHEAREAFEKEYIARALRACGGNVTQTAERIGLDRKNLQDKIRKYGLKAS